MVVLEHFGACEKHLKILLPCILSQLLAFISLKYTKSMRYTLVSMEPLALAEQEYQLQTSIMGSEERPLALGSVLNAPYLYIVKTDIISAGFLRNLHSYRTSSDRFEEGSRTIMSILSQIDYMLLLVPGGWSHILSILDGNSEFT
jgi:hypothetical protein